MSERTKTIRDFARSIARTAIRELKKAEFVMTTKEEEREMQDIVEYVARRELSTLPELVLEEKERQKFAAHMLDGEAERIPQGDNAAMPIGSPG